MFAPLFWRGGDRHRKDGAVLDVPGGRLTFTTDAYVVRPLFFPGGDIGMLAVNGTVNDLAVCGAQPRYLSGAFILEEGVSVETLRRVAASMAAAAREAGVEMVTGDTKVVERGKGDNLYVITAGVGVIPEGREEPGPEKVEPGDRVIVTGDLGRHGVAVMTAREGFAFETRITSDCAPLNGIVEDIYRRGITVHCMRDLTRGGLASALNEIASFAGIRIELEEERVPVGDEVRGACELLGLDPFYVANEGAMVVILPARWAEQAVEAIRSHPAGRRARLVGSVAGQVTGGRVVVRSVLGTYRVLDMLSGEQLPRIC
ncbi:MAG TPA: hydrogenase expression/formation protein HypE [Kiritimatiellae bacterium]|nr:hydrogenase expression/formation protein HypE [Kiritimatiellia bacterium]